MSEELQRLRDNLPTTEDGVIVVPQMVVWKLDKSSLTSYQVTSIVKKDLYLVAHENITGFLYSDAHKFYSSRETAVEARNKGEPRCRTRN